MQIKNKMRINYKDTSISLYTVVSVEVILPNPVLKKSSDNMKVVSWSSFTIAHQVHSIISLQVIKKESTSRRLSNKCEKKLCTRIIHIVLQISQVRLF